MSTTNVGSKRASGLFTSFVQRHTLPVFFVLVFVLTWPVEIIDALGSHGILSFRPSVFLQLLFVAYMPSVAALIVTALTSGGAGVRALLKKLLIWRVGVQWYAVALFGFALICFSSVILYNLLSGASPLPLLASDAANASGLQLTVNIIFILLVSAVINGEELAWRGFALPRLQTRWNALPSSIILGVIWALFHLPLFYTLGSSQWDMSLLGYTVQLVGASVIFTWLYNNTRGSVLLAMLMHASLNTWTRVFPVDRAPALVNWLMAGVTCLIAVILVLLFGARHLRRDGKRIQDAEVTRG